MDRRLPAPPNLHYSGEHGFDIYGGVHYEQLGSVTGSITLHGETISVDCHHFRDHSRGLRPGPAHNLPGGGFDFAWASEETSFAVTSARPDPPKAPVTARSIDRISYGHMTKDGLMAQVVDGTREVLERESDGRPRRVVLHLIDEHGREMHAQSQVVNCLKCTVSGICNGASRIGKSTAKAGGVKTRTGSTST